MVELDHVFVRVERGAPEAEVLRRAGLVELGRMDFRPVLAVVIVQSR